MTRIFISYRRGDSELFTGRLADHLRNDFGEQAVFHDIDSIPFGVDFRDHISSVIRQCDVLLAVIGKSWLTPDERGKRRIDDARDFVRIEIESALDAGLVVIPVLAGDIEMPDENALPAPIAKLAYINAARIDTGRDFRIHTERLIQGIRSLSTRMPEKSEDAPVSSAVLARTVNPEPEPSVQAIAPLSSAAADDSGTGSATAIHIPDESRPVPSISAKYRVLKDSPHSPELVVLPRGAFMMGSTEGLLGIGRVGGDEERPQRRVVIGHILAFAKTPVTFEQWDACVRAGGCDYIPQDEGWGRGDRPVIHVSWNDAQCYLHWLNQQAGFDDGDPHRYRLPSEAEWEYACRARNEGRWCFGDIEFQLREYAWYFDNSQKRTQPVGSRKPNAFGLCDMHGNVWEWVQDVWHRNYLGAPGNGSAWINGGDSSRRVLRGGSWFVRAENCRSASRLRDLAGNRDRLSGFRVVRTLPD